jgi:tRNA nucleotidyltransferase (CCA-adding enzyme)
MNRLAASEALKDATLAMVAEHSRPLQFMKGGATDKAYRRLARKLGARGTTMEVLELVARADFRGRATPDAAGPFAAGDEFLRRAAALEVESSAPADVVLGRHLIERGMAPSPAFGEILERCRDIQYETGWDDPERILDHALEEDD